jgi:hypothetical protein
VIFLLLGVVLLAAAIAAFYEYGALVRHWWPTITYEVRLGERQYPIIYAPILFALGALAGHFWQ